MFLSEAPRYLMYFMSFFILDRIGTTSVYQQGTNAVTLEASEGSDIILPCSPSTKEDMVLGVFDWKKNDGTEVFMCDAGTHYNNGRQGQNERFRGRVSHFPDQLKFGNASIRINNTKVEDSGTYRCIFPRLQPPEEKIIKLVVHVTLEASKGSDIILPCSTSTKKDMVLGVFDWKKDDGVEVFMYEAGIHYNNGRPGQDERFKGRVSHFPDQLKVGNASIVIRNTTVNDSGSYRCIFPRLQPPEEKIITLVVHGAAAKPIVEIWDVTKDGVQLNCVVAGATSQPKVEWQDGDGNPLHAEEPQVSRRGDHYYVSVQITVTKTKNNRFYCVATQENIHHVISDEIHVRDQLFESCSPDVGLPIGLGVVIVVLGAVIVVGLIYIRHLRKKGAQQTNGCNCRTMQPLNPENQC